MNRLDLIEPTNLSGFAPLQKFDRRPMIGRARIRIANVDGEKFQEALLGPLPCPGNQRRQFYLLPPPVFPITTSSLMPGPYHMTGKNAST
jgi:hypothetical protein